MTKRSRKSAYYEQPRKKKRRRSYSQSRARGSQDEMDNSAKIRKLLFEVQILRAHIILLQREVQEFRQSESTEHLNERNQVGKDKNTWCNLM